MLKVEVGHTAAVGVGRALRPRTRGVEVVRRKTAIHEGFEPIEADEVAAFKRALADAAGTNPAPVVPARPGGAPVRSGPIRPRPPNATGFEDTEMPGAEERGPDLSSTQYGELR